MYLKTLISRVIIGIFLILSLQKQQVIAETATAYATITVIIPERPQTKITQENGKNDESEYYKGEERIRLAKTKSETEYISEEESEKDEKQNKNEK